MNDSTKKWFDKWFKAPSVTKTGDGYSTPAHLIEGMSGYFSSPDDALGVVTVTPKSIYYHKHDRTLLFNLPLAETKIKKAFGGQTLKIQYKDQVYVLSPIYEHFADLAALELVTATPASVNSAAPEFMRKIKKFQKDIKDSTANS